jgi:hypothetical protein
MSLDAADFVHPNHLPAFVAAAESFNCHILVRQTGRAAMTWVGKRGYTGKRADLKAKTASRDHGRYRVAGLVCSPALMPHAFTAERLASARKEWAKCAHLITVPENGFDDDRQPRGCRTPYLVQTKTDHRHYGCVALVDMGLLVPRYVHGDYDLYALIPAGRPFNPAAVRPRHSTIGSTMAPDSLTLRQRIELSVANLEGPLSLQIATFVNNQIERGATDLLGALMVNHGEQINIGKDGVTFEPVLAIMPRPMNGQPSRVLATRQEHEEYYAQA